MSRLLKRCLTPILLAHAAAAMAAPLHVAIDSHALPATGYVVAFDLIDGGIPANTVTLSHLATDGSFAAATLTGGAAAFADGMTLSDTQFFNEILLPVSAANGRGFDIDMTMAPPQSGSLPDAFSLFLLDPVTIPAAPMASRCRGRCRPSRVGPNRVEAKPTINRSTISGGSIGLLESPDNGKLPTLIVSSTTFSGSKAFGMQLDGNTQCADCTVERNGHGFGIGVVVSAHDPGQTITFERCKIRDKLGGGMRVTVSDNTN